ncbi:hydroxymethylglutaryl-CoA synthase [Rhodotorula toruloides]|uniref:Hydroxymethylglutaryl-CoA synthase n=1 Tax=Rhodotorula toruloides TaxID=5286 RepID=A0A2Z6EZ47_RHOTO|nr:hydroxymethylglutaryl-CoA synthase [Rhodotorula toruloides]GEM07511.1 hydroxymethylglutaryl-CoA synthase [Rhodotorula toruloides]
MSPAPSSRFQPHTPNPATRPQNVGIHAIEVYSPMRCIDEADLERFDGVPAGKYTVGLGQERMAFCDDREDINSFLLTVTKTLLEKYEIPPASIGRIDVGTETLIDKSKSVKTLLMDLFPGNSDIEGIDSKNACYGGTAALFNAVNWVESSSWDGRYAIVVAGDIAIYAEGGARPVGGAGACAMLIGPNAPLALEPVHGTHMANVYDFYKPHLSSEYPEVDGPLTQTCYPTALEMSYDAFRTKESRRLGNSQGDKKDVSLDDFDYVCFHSPYGKLVQKGFARLMYKDFLSNPDAERFSSVSKAFLEAERASNVLDKEIEKAFTTLSSADFKAKVGPSTLTSKRLGNMYAGSVYGAFASLLDTVDSKTLQGKRIALYSYGSGLAASFFTVRVKGDTSEIHDKLKLKERLDKNQVRSCEEFVEALKLREEKHNISDYTPSGRIEDIPVGAYYLHHCDSKHRRVYKIRGHEGEQDVVVESANGNKPHVA